MYRAVFWDFGGVITESPFEAFNRYEAANGLPKDFIRGVNTRNFNDNAWAKFERNEISIAEFDRLFAAESEQSGHRIQGADIIQLLAVKPRPSMVKALQKICQDYTTVCITNNVAAGHGAGMQQDEAAAEEIQRIMEQFDFVLESSKVGIRKPDPRIYQLACEQVNIAPNHVIYLDDLGVNLKPAKALGMATIKVAHADQAIDELENLLKLNLR